MFFNKILFYFYIKIQFILEKQLFLYVLIW